ncbi:MAG: serine hydrolase domain-containing protein [Bacteroidota bacterium]
MKYAILSLIMLSAISLWGQSGIEKRIDAILAQAVPDPSTPGLTLGLVQGKQLIYQGSRGSMNMAYQLPFNDSTVFGLASVTKQFTAACIGILAHQGRLSVTDDVRTYLPELAVYGDTIRIKHLLNHSSGIRNHNVLLDLKGFDFKHRGYTNQMIQELMFKQAGVNNPPGERMLYSNTNYVLLALVVERVSGLPIHQFAEREIFEPLGMVQTFYKSDVEAIVLNQAVEHVKTRQYYKQPRSLNLCVGAGGIISSIADMSIWTQIFLDPNHKFSYLKDFITELDSLNSGEPMKHARGMFVSAYKGQKTYNHSGRNWGMRAQFICVPDLDLALIVYTNSAQLDAVGISYQILDLFMDAQVREVAQEASFIHTTKQLEAFCGTYQELNSDFRMSVFVENDTLKALSSFGREATPLKSKGEALFCRLDDQSVSYVFEPRSKASTSLEVDFGGAIFYFERIEVAENLNQSLDDFVGQYYSDELAVNYTIRLQGEQLLLSYPNQSGLALREIQTDVLGANRRTKYTFHRNAQGAIISFAVAAEGTVKDILFKRID